MSEELYEFYQTNSEFRGYVDRWCKQHDKSIFEVFRYKLVQEYAKWLKENKHGKK